MFAVGNTFSLSASLLFLELSIMLLGIIVVLVYLIDISLASTYYRSYSHYTIKYNAEVMSTIDFFFVLGPTLLVIFLVVPSMGLIFQLDAQPTLSNFNSKVLIVGNQWYWTYKQSLQFFDPFILLDSITLGFEYDSLLDPSELLYRYQKVDRPLVVPVGSSFCLITSQDVIHSWALPSHTIKTDAVPGRTQSFALTGLTYGVFFGQCSELCGVHHARMPIEVHFVPEMVWFISSMDEIRASALSSPIHHFVNVTVNSDLVFFLLNSCIPFEVVTLLNYYCSAALHVGYNMKYNLLIHSDIFFVGAFTFIFFPIARQYSDLLTIYLVDPSTRSISEGYVYSFVEDNVLTLQSWLVSSLEVIQFFYFTNIALNSVMLLIVSFIVFFMLLSQTLKTQQFNPDNVTVILFFTIIVNQFVYKVVSDYLSRLNGSSRGYVSHFFPYFLWLFVFIFYMNVAGLLPFSFTLFSVGYVTITLSSFTWLGHFLLGFHYKSFDFLMVYFDPDLPGMVSGFVGMLEITSVLIRPLSLGLRLTANMIGGHLIVEMLLDGYIGASLFFLDAPSFTSFIFLLGGLLPVLVMYGYELCVALIQSYVFVLLLLIYLREALDLTASH